MTRDVWCGLTGLVEVISRLNSSDRTFISVHDSALDSSVMSALLATLTTHLPDCSVTFYMLTRKVCRSLIVNSFLSCVSPCLYLQPTCPGRPFHELLSTDCEKLFSADLHKPISKLFVFVSLL